MATATKRKASSQIQYVNPEASAFGQRASQIKEAKRVTFDDLVERTGLTRGKLQNILAGKRYPQNQNEIEKLASAFGVEVGALKGDNTDFNETVSQLDDIIQHKDFESAHPLIQKLQLLSICLNDDLDTLFYQGRTLRGLHKNEDAEQIVITAYETVVDQLHAGKMQTDDIRFIRACNEIIQHYFYTNQNQKLVDFVASVNEAGYFTGKPHQQAIIANYLGFSALSLNDHEEARKHLAEASSLYMIAGKREESGRCEANIGTNLLLHVSAWDALEHFQRAIERQKNDALYNRCVTNKEFARSLICVGQVDEAIEIASSTLEFISSKESKFNELKAKLLLMIGDASYDIPPLEEALNLEYESEQLRVNLHHLLSLQYMSRSNFEKASFHHNACVDILKRCKDYEEFRRGEWF